MAGKKGMKWAPKLTSPTTLENLRQAIEAEKIIHALKNHALGNLEMTPSQVTAGLGLLKKQVADLTSVTGELNQNVSGEWTIKYE